MATVKSDVLATEGSIGAVDDIIGSKLLSVIKFISLLVVMDITSNNVTSERISDDVGNGVILSVTTVLDSTDDIKVSNCIVEYNAIVISILKELAVGRVLVACTSIDCIELGCITVAAEAGDKVSTTGGSVELITAIKLKISTGVTSTLLMSFAVEITNVSVIRKLLWILLLPVDCIVRVDVVAVISSTVTSSVDKIVELVIG